MILDHNLVFKCPALNALNEMTFKTGGQGYLSFYGV